MILNPTWLAVQPSSRPAPVDTAKNFHKPTRAKSGRASTCTHPCMRHVSRSQHWSISHRLLHLGYGGFGTVDRRRGDVICATSLACSSGNAMASPGNHETMKPRDQESRKPIISSLSVHPSAHDVEKCPRPAARHIGIHWPQGKDQRTYLL